MDNSLQVENTKSTYEIVGVKFNDTSKSYYFDPDGLKIPEGAHVIVDTMHGPEFGTVTISNKTVNESELVLPLKKVIRVATDDDEVVNAENKAKEAEAFDICLSKIADNELDMKLVAAEYTFDRSKLLFYFTSDGRVDFRKLVKDLATVFKTRIELRQIGIRDETKLIGGLGLCGRPFCCKSFLNDFAQVSIKMAKEQNLSLNSQKISGACGRLMCCLRYEHEVYEEALSQLPKIDSLVETPDGKGVVCDLTPLSGIIKVKFKFNDDEIIKIYSKEDIKILSKPQKEEKEPEMVEEE
jgi:cell fate regulator YaaT (PSP1 superfamily)